jgi:predicted porin
LRIQKHIKLTSASLAPLFAAIPLSAFAQSSVSLYGTLDNATVYASNQKGHSNVYMRGGTLNANKIGFLGTEDLGGGTQAVFTIEQGFDVDKGTQATPGLAFSRQAFVGLANGNYGTVTMGRQYTAYIRYVGSLSSATTLTGGTGAHPGDVDGFDTSRVNNSVVYATPVYSGFQLSAMHGFGGVPGSLSSGNSLSAALKYDDGPLSAAVGYLKVNNTDGARGAFDPGASGSFAIATSPVNIGYVSAKSVQYLGAAARYGIGNLKVALNFSNAQYRPGTGSLFSETAMFNTYGVYSSWLVTPTLYLVGGYSYTRERAANGITDPAHYHQFSFEETYFLSKRTVLYFLQSYQVAGGTTLGQRGTGDRVNAVAVVGDSQNNSPSSGRYQFVGMAGIRLVF